jgi:hypothetical protein
MDQQPHPGENANRPDAETRAVQVVTPPPGEQLQHPPHGTQTLGFLTTPLSLRGIPAWVVYFFTIIGIIYALNPTAGFLEIVPDNLPIIGNLDEGAAFLAIWYGLVEFFEGRKYYKKEED